MHREVVVATGPVKYDQNISIGRHVLQADEPVAAGGGDAGPDPYELLMAALGTCTAITIQMYADHRKWPLQSVRVRLSHARGHAEDCSQCAMESPKLDRIELAISMRGDLSDQQRSRLMDIAQRCPVHNTLSAPLSIETREWRDPPAL